MSYFTFSKQQIAKLQNLSCIAKVTPKMLVFTQEFKREALQQFNNGKPRRDILREAGIDDCHWSSDAIKHMF
jgi:hypothetical protein